MEAGLVRLGAARLTGLGLITGFARTIGFFVTSGFFFETTGFFFETTGFFFETTGFFFETIAFFFGTTGFFFETIAFFFGTTGFFFETIAFFFATIGFFVTTFFTWVFVLTGFGAVTFFALGLDLYNGFGGALRFTNLVPLPASMYLRTSSFFGSSAGVKLNIAFVCESKRRRVSLTHVAFHPHPRLARVTRSIRPSLAATIDRFER
jgi:hypothetical protein